MIGETIIAIIQSVSGRNTKRRRGSEKGSIIRERERSNTYVKKGGRKEAIKKGITERKEGRRPNDETTDRLQVRSRPQDDFRLAPELGHRRRRSPARSIEGLSIK